MLAAFLWCGNIYNMTERLEGSKSPEQLDRDEAVTFLKDQIARWRFETENPGQNIRFAYLAARWMMEYFGHKNDYPGAGERNPSHTWGPFAYGLDGELLPDPIKPTITRAGHDDLILMGNNKIVTTARYKYQYMDSEFVIPKYDEISKLPTIEEREQAIISDPEILDNIEPPRVFIADTINISIETEDRAGLDFEVDNKGGVSVNAFGERGYTKEVSEFIKNNAGNTNMLCQCILGLTILVAEYSDKTARTFPASCKQTYFDWLIGADKPAINFNFVPYPPGMKYHYYKMLFSDEKLKTKNPDES